MLVGDPLFWKSLWVTGFYTALSVPVSMAFAFGLASLLNKRIPGLGIFRTIFYLPSLIPVIATSILWLWMYNPDFGLFNAALGLVGIDKQKWIYSEWEVIPALVFMSMWSVGPMMIIFLAGLQDVPQQLYEAVDIDGGNAWHKLRYVTLPMMTPTILFNLLISMVASLQTFIQPFVMTEGGPNNGSLFFVYFIYRTAFQQSRMGYASALAWALFVVVGLLSLLVFQVLQPLGFLPWRERLMGAQGQSFRELLLRRGPGVGGRRVAFVACILLSAAMLLPLAWLVRSSLMQPGQIFIFPPQWIPKSVDRPELSGRADRHPVFPLFLEYDADRDSHGSGTLFSSSLAAFGFSRLNWPGRDLIFGILLSTLMLPYIITLLPTFLLWSKIGLTNSYVPLIVPHWLGFQVFYIFLLRQFFKNLPRELDEAAIIDGAHVLQVFWFIVLPLSRPALIVVAILSALFAWNDFLDPLVYISDGDKYTLALGLTQFTGLFTSQWNLLMAATTVIIVPVLLVFFLTQRYFIAGVTMSGLKG